MESIKHKFTETDFSQGFSTRNGILENKSYEPEILFLGTFNPTLDSNPADFFYGRNYFWTAFKNLFIHNEIILNGERLENFPYNPTIDEILKLCLTLKITFTDLISEINDENNQLKIKSKGGKEYIEYNSILFNPIKDGDLEKLDKLEKIKWNTKKIIDFLIQKPSITNVYFTRTQNGSWKREIDDIKQSLPNIEIISIYTPSAQGGALHNQTEIYFVGKMIPLLRHWVRNEGVNNGRIDNDWLIKHGVNIENF
jgi:hypothetical protein